MRVFINLKAAATLNKGSVIKNEVSCRSFTNIIFYQNKVSGRSFMRVFINLKAAAILNKGSVIKNDVSGRSFTNVIFYQNKVSGRSFMRVFINLKAAAILNKGSVIKNDVSGRSFRKVLFYKIKVSGRSFMRVTCIRNKIFHRIGRPSFLSSIYGRPHLFACSFSNWRPLSALSFLMWKRQGGFSIVNGKY